jgi:hypothetical protein
VLVSTFDHEIEIGKRELIVVFVFQVESLADAAVSICTSRQTLTVSYELAQIFGEDSRANRALGTP